MTVLLAHNFHRTTLPSGEDVMYRRERALLEQQGLKVHTFELHNDSTAHFGLIDYVRTARDLPFSRRVYAAFAARLREVQPDLVHVHNTFPLMTPAVFAACKAAGVPVVHTLHNHYLFCANGTCTLNGQPCLRCLDERSIRPGIRHGCYGGSRLATLPVARLIRRTWQQGFLAGHVDGFITMTAFDRDLFTRAGLPPERLFVRPNFSPDPLATLDDPAPPDPSEPPYVVFVGRLSREKGVPVLLDAARRLSVAVKIVGSGPEADAFREQATDLPNVSFLGQRSQAECFRLMRRAHALVFPSVCYETFGLTLIEAFACETPVIASDLGGITGIVEAERTGLLFPPGDAAALADRIHQLVSTPNQARTMGRAARRVYEACYTPAVSFTRLLEIYDAVRRSTAA